MWRSNWRVGRDILLIGLGAMMIGGPVMARSVGRSGGPASRDASKPPVDTSAATAVRKLDGLFNRKVIWYETVVQADRPGCRVIYVHLPDPRDATVLCHVSPGQLAPTDETVAPTEEDIGARSLMLAWNAGISRRPARLVISARHDQYVSVRSWVLPAVGEPTQASIGFRPGEPAWRDPEEIARSMNCPICQFDITDEHYYTGGLKTKYLPTAQDFLRRHLVNIYKAGLVFGYSRDHCKGALFCDAPDLPGLQISYDFPASPREHLRGDRFAYSTIRWFTPEVNDEDRKIYVWVRWKNTLALGVFRLYAHTF